jgi:hypothetical protein
MRALHTLALVAMSLDAAACTSTYHPEYHPVTVTSYEQHVTSPAPGNAVAQGRAPAAGGVTLVAPPPPQPSPPPPWSAWPSE